MRNPLPQARRLRTFQTKAELILWRKLRAKRFHRYKFRRQVPIDQYIVDFCCFEKRLIIEVDGDVHLLKQSRDQRRERYLRSQEFNVLRFHNQHVKDSLEWVLERIALSLGEASPSTSTGEG